jgi:hypothetical protein
VIILTRETVGIIEENAVTVMMTEENAVTVTKTVENGARWGRDTRLPGIQAEAI